MPLPQLNSSKTTSFVAPSPVQLSRSARVIWLASLFRSTALSFMNWSSRWSPADLAAWLEGPCADAMKYAPHRRLRSAIDLDARFAEIDRARTTILSLFEMELADGTVGQFAFDMIEAGLIVPCEDVTGAPGWVPTGAGKTLGDHVLSLFAADYMTRAHVFEEEISVCRDCERIVFDLHHRGCAGCAHGYRKPALESCTSVVKFRAPQQWPSAAARA